MTFPPNIGLEDVADHANQTAVLKKFFKLGEEWLVDYLIGHSAIVGHSDDVAARDNHKLIEVVQRLVASLNAKIKQSEELCEAVSLNGSVE